MASTPLAPLVAVLGALMCFVVAIVACDSEHHSTQCSTGPAATTLGQKSGADFESGPACVPRCGAERLSQPMFDAKYPATALPSGSCESGDRCTMTASMGTATCNGRTIGCDVSWFGCECSDESWKCYVLSQGGGSCGPSPCGGADAGAAPGFLSCSAGPPQASLERKSGMEFGSAPACVPRCGEEKLSQPMFMAEYAATALPSGTCESGARCSMTASLATQTCNGMRVGCDVSGFGCECTGGSWKCYLLAQGGGACGPCPLDAGTD